MPEAGPIPAGSGLPRPAQTQQPPMGVSPATGPTPNKGYEAAAMQAVSVALKHLEAALQQVGSTSDMGKAVLDALTKLSKIAPPGSVSPASQRNETENMHRKQLQNQQMMKQMAAGGQGAPGMAGSGAGAAPPQAGVGMAA